MAHTVCGIDLGAASVKLVFLEVGFRTTAFRGLTEVAVGDGDGPLLDRQMAAVRDGIAQMGVEITPYLAVAGDQLSVRVLDLPFTDSRKIDQVIGYELESQIVSPIEDVVFDHLVVDQRTDGSTVLAAAVRSVDLTALIAAAETHGVYPRAIYGAPVVYRTLLSGAPPAVEGEAPRCRAVLDFGHLRTNVCVVRDGNTVYARTIGRGGAHLTQAIARGFNADAARAEQAKRGEAFLAGPDRPAATPLTIKLDAVLREALGAFVRELRQTLASFQAAAHMDVDELLVVGGGARLAGLLPYLQAELGLPARYLSSRQALADAGARGADVEHDAGAAESDPYALAAAIALAAARGSREIDFRRGPFTFRASYSILRQKAWHLAALGAALIVAGGVDVGAKLSSLGAERKLLDKELKTATQELFGQSRDDAEAVTQLLRKGFREELAPLPKATAYDLLGQISRKVPPADKVKLDIAELDIRPKKTFIKGTVDSGAAVDDIAAKLKEIDCFEDVTKGAITEVSGGGKQFTLTVSAKCP